ncbi:hypothetical protein BK809_0007310 [Diplodia seriata]|uniref:T6SS Phospholipase effector Tle1-like catalytic domain-containing protein n=1 Tax=Diplodia seriata TaxID=420778 RepID=A0A1S8BIB0_9PEZI|nr:hypothetical protein BK809_0007310 [Diplodia seriata]
MSSRTKRLILCCDGSFTSQPASHSPSFAHSAHTASNVARFSRMLARHGANDVPQIIFYLSGLASTLEQDVAAAYLFLAANHAAGDQIAVFGGGKGASTARIVVGLLTEVGLLKPGEVVRWGRLWELYTERMEWGCGDGEVERGDEGFWKGLLAHRSRRELDEIEGLRDAMWVDVRVRVVGVWDTVGVAGRISRLTFARAPDIDHAFQALALDENRASFDPLLWRLDLKDSSKALCAPNLKQCWFPGFHETVGGGATDTADAKDRTDIADITLAWMCDQVDGLLDFDDDAVAEFLGAEQSTTHPRQPDRQNAHRRSHSGDCSEMPMSTAGGGLMYTLLTATLSHLLAAISFLQQDEADGTEGGCAQRYAMRTPGQYYKKLEFAEGVHPDDFVTNESIHPSVKHRKDLFALASTPYDPASLREWAVGDDVDDVKGKNHHNSADEKRVADSTAMTGWLPWLSAFSMLEDDEDEDDGGEVVTAGEEEAEGRGTNTINTAAERVRATAVPRRKPHPRWVYREIEGEGDGAEWIRPSVPRSELFGSPLLSSSPSFSSFCASPSEKALHHRLQTLVPAYLRRSLGSLSSPLCLFFFVVFWPWFFLYHILSFFFPLFPIHSKTHTTLHHHHHGEKQKEKRKTTATNRAPVQWHHERQIALPEWVIREVPGRRNFEAQLLPWLVREQLNRRNAKRLDWRGDDVCWARSAFGIMNEEEADEPEGEGEVAKRGDGVRSGGSASEMGAGGPPVVKRRGPLHVRKGSTAEVVVAGNLGTGERRQSHTAAGGGWRTGGGLKVLAQQPERRSSIKRERDSPTGFSPGHKKSQSQTSVGWR